MEREYGPAPVDEPDVDRFRNPCPVAYDIKGVLPRSAVDARL